MGCHLGGACLGAGSGRRASSAWEGDERHARIATMLAAGAKRIFSPLTGQQFYQVLLLPLGGGGGG